MTDELHKHVYKFGLAKIIRIENPEYTGTAGDMAFILEVCSCGKVRGFDYGNTKKMTELYERVKHKNN